MEGHVRATPVAVLAIVASLLALVTTPAGADECWLTPPAGYVGIGGAATLGPYGDYYAALGVNNEYFNGLGSIECRGGAGDREAQSRFRYGAARFHNNTGHTMTFSVRRRPGGDWDRVTVEPGYWYWWWQECPCRFHADWDGDRAAGYQRSSREVWWYGHAERPDADGARDWQFLERGDEVVLVEGATAPARAPVEAPGVAVSLVGGGEGVADAHGFAEARRANGTFYVDFMPRVAGVVPRIDGRFEMRRDRVTSPPDALVHESVWTIETADLAGRGPQRAQATIYGGAGSAEFWFARVPGNEAAGWVRMRIGIQFSGSNVRLSFSHAP